MALAKANQTREDHSLTAVTALFSVPGLVFTAAVALRGFGTSFIVSTSIIVI